MRRLLAVLAILAILAGCGGTVPTPEPDSPAPTAIHEGWEGSPPPAGDVLVPTDEVLPVRWWSIYRWQRNEREAP